MDLQKKYILVVGGAGYIGSHMVLALQQADYVPIVLDNLSKGHQEAIINAKLIVGDMADEKLLNQLFTTYQFSAVMHFASFIEVAESVKFPEKYYQNNVAATLTLLDVMLKHGIKHFIFSSTAAVYGEPETELINEQHKLAPINPYGCSKRIVENVLRELADDGALNYAALRYFNAAGADPSGRVGELHQPESHLIPIVLRVAAGKQNELLIYGDQYSTHDGTCVRDYVHVTDLCAAHLLALEYLFKNNQSLVSNLGTGNGYSVLDVVTAARRITNATIATKIVAPRAGDSAILVADASYAKSILHWQPRYSNLDLILQHAWHFMCDKQVKVC